MNFIYIILYYLSIIMNLPNIIGISGKKYHGKDTLANHLIDKYGYKRIAFADPIKDICKIVFGLSNEQLTSNLKEEPDEYWKVSPRKLMQFIGTDLFRNNTATIMPEIGDDIWIHVLVKKIADELLINPHTKFVITDVRFDNELEYISKLNGLKIKVQRNNIINIDNHVSESYIDKLNVDYIINNDDTIENLNHKIDKLLQHIRFTTICKFNMINITENTLIVLDIDDTIITFNEINNKWWRQKYNEYKHQFDNNLDIHNYILNEWESKLYTSTPSHTDETGLINLIINSKIHNSNIICLTARKKIHESITYKHFSDLNIDLPIYFSNGNNKGEILENIIRNNYSEYKKIIFVDDQIKNLRNVHEHLSKHFDITCYYYRI